MIFCRVLKYRGFKHLTIFAAKRGLRIGAPCAHGRLKRVHYYLFSVLTQNRFLHACALARTHCMGHRILRGTTSSLTDRDWIRSEFSRGNRGGRRGLLKEYYLFETATKYINNINTNLDAAVCFEGMNSMHYLAYQ